MDAIQHTVAVNSTGQTVNLDGTGALGGVTLSSTGAAVNVNGAGAQLTVNGEQGGTIKLTAAGQVLTVADTGAKASTVEVKSTGQTVNLSGTSGALGAVTLSSTGAAVNLSGAGAQLTVNGAYAGTIKLNAASQTLTVTDTGAKASTIEVNSTGQTVNISGFSAGRSFVTLNSTGATVNVVSASAEITVSGTRAGTINLNGARQILTVADNGAKASTVEVKGASQTVNLSGTSGALGGVTLSSTGAAVNLSGAGAVLSVSGTQGGTIRLNAALQTLTVADTGVKVSSVEVNETHQIVNLSGTGVIGMVTLGASGAQVNVNGYGAQLTVSGRQAGTINLKAENQTLNLFGTSNFGTVSVTNAGATVNVQSANAEIAVSGSYGATINLQAAGQKLTLANADWHSPDVVYVQANNIEVTINGEYNTIHIRNVGTVGTKVHVNCGYTTIYLDDIGQIVTLDGSAIYDNIAATKVMMVAAHQVLNLSANYLFNGIVTVSSTDATVNVNGANANLTVNGTYGAAIKINNTNQTITFAATSGGISSVTLSSSGANVNVNAANAQLRVDGFYGGAVYLNAAGQKLTVANDTWNSPDTVYVQANNAEVTLNGEKNTVRVKNGNISGTKVHVNGGYTNIYLDNVNQDITLDGSATFGDSPSTRVTMNDVHQVVHLAADYSFNGYIESNSWFSYVDVLGVNAVLSFFSLRGGANIFLVEEGQKLVFTNRSERSYTTVFRSGADVEVHGQSHEIYLRGDGTSNITIRDYGDIPSYGTPTQIYIEGANISNVNIVSGFGSRIFAPRVEVNGTGTVGHWEYEWHGNIRLNPRWVDDGPGASLTIQNGTVHIASGGCRLNGTLVYADNVTYRFIDYTGTLVSGRASSTPFASSNLLVSSQVNTLAVATTAAPYDEVLVSHSSQSADFDFQGAMPTQDYVSVRDGNNQIVDLIVNEQEIFNPTYLQSGNSTEFSWNYKNDPSIQRQDINGSNEWTSKVKAPSLAGYSSTEWALAWDNSVNHEHGGAGYITLRGYK